MNTEEISMKLFGKKTKDVKFLMLSNYLHKALAEEEDFLRTGLYSWMPVMRGDIAQWQTFPKEKLKDYDIIHVNLSGQDVHIVGDIKEYLGKDSKTKVVANNDYTVELWQGSFEYMSTLKRELQNADMIFGTEPYQAGALEVLTGRKIHTMVHPCFVKRLKSLSKPKQKNTISVVWHRYDSYSVPPSLAVKDLGFETRLLGYDPNSDKKKYITSCHYSHIVHGTNYMDFCTFLQESKIVVDPFTLTSQSRTGWDCAAMGLPMVGSNRNYSARICYPQTSCDPFDIKEIRRLTKKLLNDEKFKQEIIDYAQKAVEMVSYDNSRKSYFEHLYEGSPKLEEK